MKKILIIGLCLLAVSVMAQKKQSGMFNYLFFDRMLGSGTDSLISPADTSGHFWYSNMENPVNELSGVNKRTLDTLAGTKADTSSVMPTIRTAVTQTTATTTDNSLLKTVGTSGRAVEQTGVTVDDNNRLGIGTLLPLASIHVGNGTLINSGYADILVSENVDDSKSGNDHAFSDCSYVTRSGSIGYNSFDGRIIIGGTSNFDHHVPFQCAPTYRSTGTLKDLYGLFTTMTQDSGVITNNHGVYVNNPLINNGVLTNNYGIYIENQTSGINNYGLYIEGASDNYINDRLTLGSTSKIGGTLEVAQLDTFSVNYNDFTGDAIVVKSFINSGINKYSGGITFTGGGRYLTRQAAITSVQTTSDIDQNGLAFFVSPSPATSGVLQENMRIIHNGNVGIKSTSPDKSLEINSSTGDNLRLTFNTFGGSAVNKVDYSVTSSGSAIIQPSNYKLGINCTAPTSSLSVLGTSATNLNLFNYVNGDINKHRITFTNATDTSSFNLSFTSTGSPTLKLAGKAGNELFKVDSVATSSPVFIASTSLNIGNFKFIVKYDTLCSVIATDTIRIHPQR